MTRLLMTLPVLGFRNGKPAPRMVLELETIWLTIRAGAPRDIRKEQERGADAALRVIVQVRAAGSRWPTSVMVLCARRLTWPREFAVTSLVARLGVSPFGKMLRVLTSRARGLLCHFAVR